MTKLKVLILCVFFILQITLIHLLTTDKCTRAISDSICERLIDDALVGAVVI